MLVGIPKECKNHEYRVGATPSLVSLLAQSGHQVIVQSGAGERIGYLDDHYEKAGAKIVPTMEEVYEAEMIVKVKEPQRKEYPLLKKGQILFCYLHLAPVPDLTKHLLEREIIGIAYETITDQQGGLPLLTPMSEVAGRIAIQAGATALQIASGGKGLLLGGVPGVAPAKVVVIGGGAVGTEAARVALGFGADVSILEKRLSRLRELDHLYGPSLKTLYSTPMTLAEELKTADLVIGAILIPGKSAPKIITEEMIKQMTPGTVFVDVAIDQGGCAETSRPTTHADPTYIEHGVVHYCVTNMPGACARTSTQALTNATAPYVLALADKGVKQALLGDRHFLEGLNVCLGHVTYAHVAQDGGFDYKNPAECLKQVV